MTTTLSRGRLPVARRDRRPMLAALAVLLILLGALGSALIAYRSGDRTPVLAASRTIPFGHVLERSDFVEVQAAADSEGVIPAEFLDQFVGTHAISQIPAGAMVHPKMFSSTNGVPEDGELVGILLDPARRPSMVPAPGQVVRVLLVAGGSSTIADGQGLVRAARVVAVGPGAGGDTVGITVLVDAEDAPTIANYASTGNLAVSILPDGTRPVIDMVAAE